MTYAKDADQYLSNITGLENYSKTELEDIIRRYCYDKIEAANQKINIYNVYLIGSRVAGTACETDDLDALVYYTGSTSSDKELYMTLNADALVIDGVKVEIHPRIISENYASS